MVRCSLRAASWRSLICAEMASCLSLALSIFSPSAHSNFFPAASIRALASSISRSSMSFWILSCCRRVTSASRRLRSSSSRAFSCAARRSSSSRSCSITCFSCSSLRRSISTLRARQRRCSWSTCASSAPTACLRSSTEPPGRAAAGAAMRRARPSRTAMASTEPEGPREVTSSPLKVTNPLRWSICMWTYPPLTASTMSFSTSVKERSSICPSSSSRMEE
mmetsp:Transcript_3412/g.9260  ORF Transcript_3412/g.9260 Transcript_3412/m.9260 type:complete len:221 (-) Transcript_3412:1352-2014(-)